MELTELIGVDGQDGYTPVKGVDYWTETEQNEIISTATTNVENNFASTIATIQSNSSNALNTANTANNTANTAKSIAEGANQALSYTNYQAMITAFNELADNVYKVGQNIMIITLNVPDLWISAIENTSITYNYTNDEAITTALSTNGYIQVGYYKLSALETQKVDLTDYYTKTGTENKIEDYLYQIMPTDSASGTIATINDSTTMFNAIDVTGTIEPVQDLHGYDSPWPAGGGANKCPEQWESGMYDVTNGTKKSGTNYIRSVSMFPVLPETSYCYVKPSGNATRILFYDANGDFLSAPDLIYTNHTSDVFTTPQGAYFMTTYTAETSYANDVAVNYPSTVTSYAPYSNICPISGWTGMNVQRTGFNVWDEEWEIGGIASGHNISETDKIRSKNYIPVVSGNTYFIYCKTSALIFLSYYDSDKNYLRSSNGIRNVAVTIPERCRYIRFRMQTTYGTTYKNDICINLSDPAKNGTYESGHVVTIPFDWQTEAGTVYGGTLDVTNGVLTVDRAVYTFDGTEGFALVSNTQVETFNYFRWYSTIFMNVIPNWASINSAIMTCYPVQNQVSFWYSGGIGKDSVAWTVKNYAGLCIRDDKYSSVEEFKTALIGQTMVYKLATPVTYQLTPQEVSFLLGTNNLWVDTGDINVTYKADIQKYIDKKTN